MRFTRVLWHILLILAMPLVQEGAVMHSLVHWASAGTSQSEPQKQLPHHEQACDKCVAYAAMGAAAGSAQFDSPAKGQAVLAASRDFLPPCFQWYPRFLSRAPPALMG
jgi:hypothetical protein